MNEHDSIVLGGGCFWCLEAAYQLLDGVVSVVPGYSGGTPADAIYDVVSSGTTEHVEVVKVTYDAKKISLENIMAVFWTIHDPTSLNRQGADAGPQYASVVFYEGEAQLPHVRASWEEAQSLLDQPIVTRIEPLRGFYEAEAYHHNYFENNPAAGYCSAVIEPKLHKLRQHFSPLLKS